MNHDWKKQRDDVVINLNDNAAKLRELLKQKENKELRDALNYVDQAIECANKAQP